MNAAVSSPVAGLASATLDRLLPGLGAGDSPEGRRPAWQDAGPLGAEAVGPLVEAMQSPDAEMARAAKRALWSVVDHAGRPGAGDSRREVLGRISEALVRGKSPPGVVRELLWMLGTLGDSGVVPLLADKLADPVMREDARCVLQRVPGEASAKALREAMEQAPDDFAVALADALRARGEPVSGRPSRRLVPSRRTQVGA